MEYSDLIEDGRSVSCIIHTDNLYDMNLLRRIILSELETYAIDYVVFHINKTARFDEELALRFGLLVIDHSQYIHSDIKHSLHVKGPCMVTTDHIKTIPFSHTTPIIYLNKFEELCLDFYIQEGKGYEHMKWKPVGLCSFTKMEKNFLLTFKSIDMMAPKEIIEKAIEKMDYMRDKAEKETDIFFKMT